MKFNKGQVWKDRRGNFWVIDNIAADELDAYPIKAASLDGDWEEYLCDGMYYEDEHDPQDLIEEVVDKRIVELVTHFCKHGAKGIIDRIIELEERLAEETCRRRELERSKPCV